VAGDRREPTRLERVWLSEPTCPYCTRTTDPEFGPRALVLVTLDGRGRVAHEHCRRAAQRAEVHTPIPHEVPPPV
jgi:hypothetical protein